MHNNVATHLNQRFVGYSEPEICPEVSVAYLAHACYATLRGVLGSHGIIWPQCPLGVDLHLKKPLAIDSTKPSAPYLGERCLTNTQRHLYASLKCKAFNQQGLDWGLRQP